MIEFGEPAVEGFWYRHAGEHLASERSAFQQIDIYRTASFGAVLVLDGLLQTTERDEFCYHEMLVHVPLLTLEQPRHVLVIGGGDGGTLRHVLMHPSVERAVMCEIDERVTAMSRRHLGSVGGDAFDDARAEVIFEDGIAYMRRSGDPFDAIIVDSSDPVGPGEGLFTEEFYRSARERLAPDGVICVQSGSPLFQQGECHRAHRNMAAALPDVRTYLGVVPTYPGTLWSYTMGGERLVPDPEVAARRATERGITARYWSPEVQRGCFDLPGLVREVIAADGPPFTWGHSPEEQGRDVPGR